jgi:hypothetical protein
VTQFINLTTYTINISHRKYPPYPGGVTVEPEIVPLDTVEGIPIHRVAGQKVLFNGLPWPEAMPSVVYLVEEKFAMLLKHRPDVLVPVMESLIVKSFLSYGQFPDPLTPIPRGRQVGQEEWGNS